MTSPYEEFGTDEHEMSVEEAKDLGVFIDRLDLSNNNDSANE